MLSLNIFCLGEGPVAMPIALATIRYRGKIARVRYWPTLLSSRCQLPGTEFIGSYLTAN